MSSLQRANPAACTLLYLTSQILQQQQHGRLKHGPLVASSESYKNLFYGHGPTSHAFYDDYDHAPPSKLNFWGIIISKLTLQLHACEKGLKFAKRKSICAGARRSIFLG